MKSQRGYLSGSFPMVIATYLGCEQTVFYLENALIILTGKIAVLQWDNGWERENWNIFHSCELHSFVPPVPESAPSPRPAGVIIHHTRLVQCHSGVQGPREHRGPECDLGEQGSSQGAGVGWDTRTSPQLLGPACELVPEPAQCQPHLCGQQLGGPENCHLMPGGSLFPWWVHLSEGKGTWELRRMGVRALGFCPHCVISTSSTGSPHTGAREAQTICFCF